LGVHADAEDDRVGGFVLGEVPLEVVRLERAAAGEILRIEVEDDPLSAVVLELGGLAFLIRQREGRSLVPDGGSRERAQTCRGEDGSGENESLTGHSKPPFVRDRSQAGENTPGPLPSKPGPSFA